MNNRPEVPWQDRVNWAHLLTSVRLFLTPVSAWAILHNAWIPATAIFVAAAISDYYDGRVARASGAQSALGGLFDHATDAAFVSVTLWALAQHGLVTPWLALMVVLAFIQYTLDSAALQGAVLRGNWLGRTNGISYFVLCGIGIIASGLLLVSAPNSGTAATAAGLTQLVAWIRDPLTYYLSWLLLISTLVSMANRLRYWLRLRNQAPD